MAKFYGSDGAMAGSIAKSKLDNDIITGTLGAVNRYTPCKKPKKGASKAMAASYDFNKEVLSSVYGKGNILAGKG